EAPALDQMQPLRIGLPLAVRPPRSPLLEDLTPPQLPLLARLRLGGQLLDRCHPSLLQIVAGPLSKRGLSGGHRLRRLRRRGAAGDQTAENDESGTGRGQRLHGRSCGSAKLVEWI